jgi:phosphatidylinositol alpha-1,6-mannosyltransferase
LVFLEANACGKPVIGGNVGGVPDAIVDGETGKLVDGSSIDAVASAVNLLLEEKELTRRMGEAGRRRALTFGWQSKADQFQAVCQEILKQ